MPKRALSDRDYGDGIYRGDGQKIERSDSGNRKKREAPKTTRAIVLSEDAIERGANCEIVSPTNGQQLEQAQRILDLLDEQISSLNKLQANKSIAAASRAKHCADHRAADNLNAVVIDERDHNENYLLGRALGARRERRERAELVFAQERNGLVAGAEPAEGRSVAWQLRRDLALDQYVERRIGNGTGVCGCHFRHGHGHGPEHGQRPAAGPSELLSELDECYRKFCRANANKGRPRRSRRKELELITKSADSSNGSAADALVSRGLVGCSDATKSGRGIFIEQIGPTESGAADGTQPQRAAHAELGPRQQTDTCFGWQHTTSRDPFKRTVSSPALASLLDPDEPALSGELASESQEALSESLSFSYCETTSAALINLAQSCSPEEDHYAEDDYCLPFEPLATARSLSGHVLESCATDSLAAPSAALRTSSSPNLSGPSSESLRDSYALPSDCRLTDESTVSLSSVSWSQSSAQREASPEERRNSIAAETASAAEEPVKSLSSVGQARAAVSTGADGPPKSASSLVYAFGGSYKDFWCSLPSAPAPNEIPPCVAHRQSRLSGAYAKPLRKMVPAEGESAQESNKQEKKGANIDNNGDGSNSSAKAAADKEAARRKRGKRGGEGSAESTNRSERNAPVSSGQINIREGRARIEFPEGHAGDGSGEGPTGEEVSMRRAVKDIAKLSIPSLSSLQYLPGKMDSRSLRSGSSSSSRDGRRRRVLSESREDVQHEDSCLFQRICLCTCLARQPAPSLQPIEAASAKSAASGRCESRSNEGDVGGGSEEAVRGGRGGELSRREREKEKEKQSPKFLNLFKSPEEAKVAQAERDVSHRSSPVGEAAEGAGPALSSPSLHRIRSSSCDSESPQAAESGLAKGQRERAYHSYRRFLKPSRLFRGSSDSSAGLPRDEEISHETSAKLQSGRQTKRNNFSAEEGSFLSRSLNRLSGGKAGPKLRQSKQRNQQNNSLSNCASPTLSSTASERLSNSGSLDEHSSSLELPGEDPYRPLSQQGGSVSSRRGSIGRRPGGSERDFRSLVLTAPEIVLGRVKSTVDSLEASGRLSAQSCEMPRQRADSGGHSRSRYAQRPHTGYDSSTDRLNQRYLSSSSLELVRASSLPASPRASRRLAVAGANGRRSPRLSPSPVPFPSPAAESSKIEDGLQVCSTEHFEKHIGNIKDSQTEAQKRLFTIWINHFCPNLIRRDLVEELRDGIKLIGLLATLTRDQQLLAQYERLNRDKQSYINRLLITPSSRLKHLSNVSISIDYLRRRLGMKLVNLNPMDIVSGKANVVLGLCWNIILNFQLEQNLAAYAIDGSDRASQYSTSDISLSTSRFSNGTSNEDRAKNIGQMIRGSGGLLEEYTAKDLLNARNKLLKHINDRFNLKLTNLTSNLIDGDVLLVIIKNLISQAAAKETEVDEVTIKSANWENMDEDEKLDHCFELAQKHLKVPRLFTANDLKQQSVSEGNSKPLLVYLSMLLTSNVGPKEAAPKTNEESTSTSLASELEQENVSVNALILRHLSEIETDDRFRIDKLQKTLSKIHELDKLVKTDTSEEVDRTLVKRCESLREEAQRVEVLINWINEADKLFEMTQRSSADLAKAIDKYQKFFAPENAPKLETTNICPTLERQYRECLATAKQRVLSMEQTMKNWISYEQARQELKEWLIESEAKLSNALRPNHSGDSNEHTTPIEQHLSRLDELIQYFELEPIDLEPEEMYSLEGPSSSERSAYNPHLQQANAPSTNSLNNFPPNGSLSGSMVSLGSVSSRTSILASSKGAAYHKLFDEFELKCRLLAAMLDADQRDALLLGVKELRARLKYITEYRVPQVVSELRYNINRCAMSIREQDEPTSESNEIVSEEVEAVAESAPEETQPVEDNACSSEDATEPFEDEDPPEVERVEEIEEEPAEISAGQHVSEQVAECHIEPEVVVRSPASKPKELNRKQPQQHQQRKKSPKLNRKPNKSQAVKSQTSNNAIVAKQETDWSLFGWILPRSKPIDCQQSTITAPKMKNKKAPKQATNSQSSNKTHSKVPQPTKVAKKIDDDDDDNKNPTGDISFARQLWHKLVRASKASLSLNIVLLICLAGICIMPLLNRDACCELSQGQIPSDRITVTQRPT